MSRNRRNKRSFKKISEVLETKTFIRISLISIAIIGICLVIIMIKNYNREIELAKQREMLEQKIVAIFEDNSYEKESESDTVKLDTTAKISIVGDILCDDAMTADAKNGETYSFAHMFQNVKDIVNNSDIAVGTMETNFTDEKFSGYGKCNSPKEFAQAVKDSGIDLVSIAHNHALDYGVEGLTKTKEYLTELGYTTVGTNTSDEESRYVVKEVKGIKIAFLAYTYGFSNEKSLKDEEKKYVNVFNEEDVKIDLENANAEADFIFVMMHWGDVYSNNVSEEQSKIAQFLVNNGADTIVGAHPTVVEPMEVVQNAEGENVFIAYSVGNYISNLGYENSNLEMILDIQIRKDGETGKVTLEKVTYTPVYMVDNGTKAENRFELVDMKETAKEYASGNKDIITEKLYKKLIKGLEKLEEIIRSKND